MRNSAFVSRLSTNSSYYYCCGETEKLLISISVSHQGSAQLQSHLKAIDCGFKRQMKWASFTSRWNDLYWSEVRVETVKSTSPGVGVCLWKRRHLGDIIKDAWVQRRVNVICSFISSSTLTRGCITPDVDTCISDINPRPETVMLFVIPKSLFTHQVNAIWCLSDPSPFVINYLQPIGDLQFLKKMQSVWFQKFNCCTTYSSDSR